MKKAFIAILSFIIAISSALPFAVNAGAAELTVSAGDAVSVPSASDVSQTDAVYDAVLYFETDNSTVSDTDAADEDASDEHSSDTIVSSGDASPVSGFEINELPPEEQPDGWYTDDDVTKYSLGGKDAVGAVIIDGKPYHFADDGALSAYTGELAFVNAARGTSDTYLFSNGSVVAHPDGSALYDFLGRRIDGDGWRSAAGSVSDIDTCYIENGNTVSGFAVVDGELRYFNNGKPDEYTGWRSVDGSEYYLENGAVVTGMVTVGGKYCFLDPDKNGRLTTGWLELFGCRYYADETGAIKRDGRFDLGGDSYIADKNGALRYGWIKLGSDDYYAGSDGKLAKNTTVDGRTLNADGKVYVAVSPVRVAAQNVISKAASSSASNSTKLRSSFNWLVRNCSYKRDYTDPLALSGNWREKYALEMLNGHRGNCYRYACAFAYIAEELGYDAQVVVGRVSAVGGGTTPHAYTQIKMNGKTYICDANLQSTRSSLNWYMLSTGSYHYYFKKVKTFDVTL